MAPESTPSPLPQDLASAHQLITTLHQELSKSRNEIALLRHKLDALCRKLFGKKTEKVSPDQLALAFEQLANETAAPSEPVETDSGESPTKERRRKPTGRRPIPANLPRQIVVQDVTEGQKRCACCGGAKVKIGEDVSEKIDYVPASVVVRQTVTPKYACPRCHDGVTSAPAAPQAVERGLAAEGLLAYVTISKFQDHLPLFRLERILLRHGIDVSRSTLCGWVADVAQALEPIYAHLRKLIVTCDYLQTDDTPVTVLTESNGSFKGRLWTYLDPLGKQVVFEATRTHERDGPVNFLSTFRGYLQADAYSGYDAVYRGGRIVEVGCWAHARRRFVEALDTDPHAATILVLVKQLFRIDEETASLSPDDRLRARREASLPVLAEIDRIRAELARRTLPKSPLGEALRYLDNQRQALGRYVDDPRLKLDNNGAERQLRAIAVGRKNWLFAGSMNGAHRAAILYTLVHCCQLAGVDPFAYFRDVLLRVATHPMSAIDQLTPKGWAQTIAPTLVAA